MYSVWRVKTSLTGFAGAASALVLSSCVELNELTGADALSAPDIVIAEIATGTVGTPIETITPENRGGTIASCTVTPDLEANTGLRLNPVNCEISGTPTRPSPTTSYTITATNATGTVRVTVSARIYGPAAHLSFERESSGVSIAGDAFTPQPTVLVTDSVGNFLNNTEVTLSPFTDATCSAGFSGSGSLLNATAVTNEDGIASFSGLAYTRPQTVYLKAVVDSLSVCSSSSTIVLTGSASKIVFTTPPSGSGDADHDLVAQPIATLQDSQGNIITGASASITLTGYSDSSCATPVASSITATSNPVTTVNGIATFAAVRVIKTSVVCIGASGGGLTPQYLPIAISPGLASALVFSTQPATTGTAGSVLSQQPILTLQDANANTVIGSSAAVTLTGYSDSGCTTPVTGGISSTSNNPLTSDHGVAFFNGVKVLKTNVIRIGASNGPQTACSTALSIAPGTAHELLVQTAPAGYLTSGNRFPTQPVIAIRDALANILTSSTASVQVDAYSNSSCTSTTGLTGALTGNSVSAVAGVATFTALTYSQAETIYLKYSSGGLSTCVATALAVGTSDASSSNSVVKASAAYAPSDGAAIVTVLVIPKNSGGTSLGTGLTLEVNITSGTATLTGASACRTPAANCQRAVDAGGGQYTITATSSSTGPVVFSALSVEAGGDVVLNDTATVDFNDSYFTGSNGNTFTATGTVTSAHASGKNLYITGGTITFDNTTVGQQFGDVFISGGTVVHTATTSGTYYQLNILANSLNIQGSASIDASSRGYLSGYSYGANGVPSTALQSSNNAGASHGGSGGQLNTGGGVGAVYDNFKNPLYPGAGATNAGGGVIRITTGNSGACVLHGSSSIKADAGTGSAGGSIYLNCGYITTSSAWSGIISARGGGIVNGCGYAPTSGGGGRIALMTQAASGQSAWGNQLSYPTSTALLSTLKGRVLATGGSGASSCGVNYGSASAGTIYLKHASLTYGDLIVHNTGVTTTSDGPATTLPALTGTMSAVSGSTATVSVSTSLSPALGASNYTNAFAGMTIRPDLTYTNGSVSDWSDDNVLTLATNTNTSFVMSSAITGMSATPNSTFRTLYLLDHLDVSGGTTLATAGDIYLTTGLIGVTSNDLNISGGFLSYTGNSGIIGSNSGITLPGFTGNLNYAVSSGTFNVTGNVNATSLSVSGTAAVTFGSTLTTTSNISVSGTGSLTVPTINAGGNIDITSTSSNALVANTINAVDFNLTGGTIKHYTTTSAAMYALNMTLSGNLTLNASSNIDVSGLGYPNGYSYGANGVPSTAYQSSNNAGASHGGSGGQLSLGGGAGTTYGNFKNPIYPGAGAGNAGGGVVRVTTGAAGICRFNGTGGTSSNIKADGSTGSAGGSINLNCGLFDTASGWTGVIAARGGAPTNTCGYSPTAGGGGRIALVSQSASGASAWTNALAYPTDSSSLSSIKSRILASGGAASYSCGVYYGNGGAGTIYLKHGLLAYGDLIVHNNSIVQTTGAGGTPLPAITGTVTAVSGSTATVSVSTTLSPALGASNYTNYFAGMTIRPDLTYTNGSLSDWSDDNVLTVSTNTNTSFVMSSAITGMSATPNSTFRTIFLLDHLEVSGGASLSSAGDFYLVSGQIGSASNDFNLATGGFTYTGNSNVIDSNSGLTFPSFTGNLAYALDSGSYIITNNVRASSFAVSNGAAITLAGTLDVSSGLTVSGTGSSLTATGTVTAASVSVSGTGSLTAPTLNVSGNIDVTSTSTSALIANTITATDFNLTGGTVKHYTTTSATMYALNMTLSGNLTLNSSAKIDVSSLGYPNGYSYGTNGVPATSLQSSNNAGGSHGGAGGQLNSGGGVGATYDDLKNPIYPGAGAQNNGGGVVRVTTGPTGICLFNGTGGTSSYIKADGGTGSAGGSINLNCGLFDTAPGWTGVIAARGGGPVNGCGYQPTSGGGGRIALISQDGSGSAAWSNSLIYPSDSATLSTFKSRVIATGGGGYSSCGVTYGSGGAGTIYLKHFNLPNGDLILSNSGITQTAGTGATVYVSTTVNHNNVTNSTPDFSSYPDSSTAKITASSTPLSSRTNLFAGALIHLFLGSDSPNPLDGSHTAVTVSSNDTNNFYFSGTPLAGRSVASDTYRFVLQLDHLDIGDNASLNMTGADLLLTGCDLHSTLSTTFDVPSGASVTGNSFSSSSCLDAAVTTKATTVNFSNYYLQ